MTRKNAQITHTMESLTARIDEVGECHEWSGYFANRTPQVSHGGRMQSVRRVVLELHGETIAPGQFASCSCRNHACVRYEHIVRRTQKQHMQAMANAEFANPVERSARITAHSRAFKAKLTIELAREIRASEERAPVLAQIHGVSKSVIHRIRNNEAWRDVSPFAGLGGR